MADGKLPVGLVKWYDYANWLLDRIDAFPKNQRFIFGQRMADLVLGIMEKLIEATYTREKAGLLREANMKMEVLRWLVRMAKDRQILTTRQYEFSRMAVPSVQISPPKSVFIRVHPRFKIPSYLKNRAKFSASHLRARA
jgi:hypothetical protein